VSSAGKSALDRLQHDFQEFILEGTSRIEAQVVGTERVPVATRLGIYLGAYRARLVEALQSTYPALAQLSGEEGFAELGAAYVRAYPSTFASLRDYGAMLADFLAAHPDYASAPLLADLARWEWTMAEVFDAAGAEPVDVSIIQQVPPESWSELRFEWHPSVRQLALLWNAPQIWKAITDEVERPQAAVGDEPVHWLIWRRELQILYRSPAAAEAAALQASHAGETFGDICLSLCAHFDEQDAPGRAAAYLSDWVRSGLIVGLR
jgi:hypothetical protein